jgi:hypothetical protein
MSSGAELSAVVFGQHVHLILMHVIFSSGVARGTNFATRTLEQKN